ncbi:MAG: hypothetical protein WDM86_02000 [Rhizomicrobium sp.]
MAPQPSQEQPAPWWRSPRMPAVILVGAVHLGLIALFILSSRPEAIPPLRHEVFLLFRPAPVRLPRKIEPPATARPAPQPFRFAPPPSTAITVPPPPASQLELSLFRCAPENLAKLAPSERAHCGEAYTARAFEAPVPGAPSEHAVDVERWRSALAARDTPAAVPCATVERIEVNQFTHEAANAVMTDPLCALRNLVDRSDH